MMTIKMTPEIEARIGEFMASGNYPDETDVLIVALDLLADYQRKEATLLAELQIAEEQIARGEVIPYDDTFMDRMVEKARERSRLGLPIKRAARP
jgi:Arc/MetJ-type ribon-helix-helix transcriptional regulator